MQRILGLFACIAVVAASMDIPAQAAPKKGLDYRHPRPAGAPEKGTSQDKSVQFAAPQLQAGIEYDTVVSFPGSEVPEFQVEKVTFNGAEAESFLIQSNNIYNLNRRTHNSEDLNVSLKTGWKAGTEYQFSVQGKLASGQPILLAAVGNAPETVDPVIGSAAVSPKPEFPYHHFTLTLSGSVLQTGTATAFVDGAVARDARFFNLTDGHGSEIDGETYKRRVTGGKDFKAVVPCNWTGGSTHEISVKVETDSGESLEFKKELGGAGAGGYWSKDWPHFVSLVLEESVGIIRQDEPVHAMLGVFADDLTNAANEIRVVTYDPKSPEAGPDGYVVTPCQVYADVEWRDQKILDSEEIDPETGKKVHRYDPTKTVELVFHADLLPYEKKVYQVFYGKADATPVDFATALNVKDTTGIGEVVETSSYRINLAINSGAIETIEVLGEGDPVLLEHKLETNGAIHWNPDFYTPPTPWVHVSDWEKPEHSEITGPLMHRTRAHAPLPHMTNVSAHVSYTFYSNQPYIVCTSLMEVQEELFVQAMRNGELVFNHAVLDEFVWLDPLGTVKSLKIEGSREHPIHALEVPAKTPWMAFISREHKVGFASMQLEFVNTNRFGDPPSEAQPYYYVQNGPWIYWSRGLVYPFGGLNFTRMMRVRAGSTHFEKLAWMPFRFAAGDNPFAEVEKVHKQLEHPIHVQEWMGTDNRTPDHWVMPILTAPFDEGVSGAASGQKETNKEE